LNHDNKFQPNYKAFRVGPLAVDAINRALGTELDSGDVWVSKACHAHMALDHPDDYQAIKASLIDILRDPQYAGQDARHGRNFYLVRYVPVTDVREYALIAIGLEMSPFGTYSVRSAYAISQNDVDSRRLNGVLKQIY
jgi:hypothetical protein